MKKKSEWQTTPIRSSKYAFTPEEIKKILEVAKQHSFRDYCLLLTLALTGRRVGEIVGSSSWEVTYVNPKYRKQPIEGLTVGDIDFENGIINWTIEKKFKYVKKKDENGNEVLVKERVKVPLKAPKILLDTLKEYVNERSKIPEGMYKNKEKIINCIKLFPMSRFNVHRIVKKYVKLAGITNRRRLVHAFRHGFAIAYLKKSSKPEDLLALKDQLQHSSVMITEGYLKFLDTQESKVLDEVASEIAPNLNNATTLTTE